MDCLHRFFRLSVAERWLLLKAALLLGSIGLGKRLLPLRTLRWLLARAAGAPAGPRRTDPHSTDTIVWAVRVASSHILGSNNCLTQALGAQLLLARRGYPARIHIGVTRSEQGQFRAHAWVESEDKVIIGGTGLERFASLAVLE
jgi:hypothetical protein